MKINKKFLEKDATKGTRQHPETPWTKGCCSLYPSKSKETLITTWRPTV